MIVNRLSIHQILIMGIIGAVLFGCVVPPTPIPTSMLTPLSNQVDKSPFTGIPCAAPCWHGLEVGKSSEKDAIEILPVLTFIDQKSAQIFRRPSMPDYYIEMYGPGVEIVANCINSNKECLNLTTANDVLQKIIVTLNYEITQEEAIEYLGKPDYVGYGNLGSERVICEVYLVWTKNRLVLASRFEDLEQAEKYCYIVGDEGRAPSNLLILEARYLSEVELNAYLSSISSKFFEFTGVGPDK